ncbi:oligosaccharide flippase family protein [Candidatus Roizmanbacteria bacterium]|nr:oligosaccharide flippase family protein [Candidatus Roizmanbacteria bacterium]
MDQDLKRRSFVSTLSLFFQSGYAAFLGLIANLILTILLTPKIFGIYITVLSIISFLNYFSDIGLAASIIQKKELSQDDVKTTFTVQQLLILTVITVGFFATSFIQKFYLLPAEGVYLYWALLFSFFISSLKTIPSVFLERKIQFQKIVFVQVIENTVFYIAVSVFALLGLSLTSFTLAVVLRAFTGLVLIYSISFWMPRVGISFQSLKKLLSFGIPFQASSFLALFKDDLVILYLGKVLGFEGVGYIGWAKKWADAPIRIIMDNVSKVLFPLIARVQEDTKKIRVIAEKILYYQTALLAPILIGMIMVMQNFVEIIPGYQKWAPALSLFYIFAVSSLIISFSAPFINLFNAVGKVRLSFWFMVGYTVFTWILTPPMTSLFGYFGFPLAHLIVSVSYGLVLLKARGLFRFQFFASIYKFILSAIVMAFLISVARLFIQVGPRLQFITTILFGALAYYLLVTSVFGINVRGEFQSFTKKGNHG